MVVGGYQRGRKGVGNGKNKKKALEKNVQKTLWLVRKNLLLFARKRN